MKNKKNILIALISLLLLFPKEAFPQYSPYESLADFVINVVDHIKWPISDKEKTLCIYGYDPVALNITKRKDISLLKIKQLTVHEITNTDELVLQKKCDLLYIAESQEKNLSKALADAQETQTLTIGQFDGFLNSGGAIEFQLIRGQIKVALSGSLLRRYNLDVSTLLLPFVKE